MADFREHAMSANSGLERVARRKRFPFDQQDSPTFSLIQAKRGRFEARALPT
jgi:hypothetical protein